MNCCCPLCWNNNFLKQLCVDVDYWLKIWCSLIKVHMQHMGKSSAIPHYFYNTFTTNLRCLVVIGSKLNSLPKLLFNPPIIVNNSLPIRI